MYYNFNNYEIDKSRMYGGRNGRKIGIIIDDKVYMLKTPGTLQNKTESREYSNSSFSEYISSHIIDSIGLSVQETLLGTYEKNNITYIAVSCKDFCEDDIQLHDFGHLKNSFFNDSTSDGYGTNLNKVLECIYNQDYINPNILVERFWDMFIVDSLLGNFDRHNGNWAC